MDKAEMMEQGQSSGTLHHLEARTTGRKPVEETNGQRGRSKTCSAGSWWPREKSAQGGGSVQGGSKSRKRPRVGGGLGGEDRVFPDLRLGTF